jgi:hypothetical protein
MYAAVRTYEISDIEELSQLVRDEFVPIVKEVPGFIAYYVVDAGNGMASSITICEDETGIEESTSRAAAWVDERAASLIESARLSPPAP